MHLPEAVGRERIGHPFDFVGVQVRASSSVLVIKNSRIQWSNLENRTIDINFRPGQFRNHIEAAGPNVLFAQKELQYGLFVSLTS
jgi:hypothetical protein